MSATRVGAASAAVMAGFLMVVVASCGPASSGGGSETGSGGTSGSVGTGGNGGSAGSTAGEAGSSAGAGGSGAGTGGSSAGTGGSSAGAAGTTGTGGNTGAGGGSAGRGGTTGTGGNAGTSGTTGTGGCTPPAQGTVVGWASTGSGTTGGGNATPVTVSNVTLFGMAVAGNTPAVVYISGVLGAGKVNIGSNKTVVGLCGAEFHGHLAVSGSSNVIVRNLKIVGYGVGNCALDPDYDSTVGCSSGNDAVTIENNAKNVWFDHCDISDGTDGNLDTTSGADLVTISWTKFHYTPRTDPTGSDNTGAEGHRFSNLIGSADNVAGDTGHLNITWDHDWWADNVNQRMPRSRAGKIHILNSLFTSTGNSYCSNAGQGAQLLIEGTVYSGVNGPLQVTQTGVMNAPKSGANANVFTNTSGNTTENGTVFAPTYTYTVDAASGVQAAVMSGAGPH